MLRQSVAIGLYIQYWLLTWLAITIFFLHYLFTHGLKFWFFFPICTRLPCGLECLTNYYYYYYYYYNYQNVITWIVVTWKTLQQDLCKISTTSKPNLNLNWHPDAFFQKSTSQSVIILAVVRHSHFLMVFNHLSSTALQIKNHICSAFNNRYMFLRFPKSY